MRRILPVAIIGVVALAGCASAGDPADSAPPTPDAPQTSPAESTPAEPTEGATADPQPTAAGDPYRIEDEAILGAYSLDDIPGDEPLVVWADAERTLVYAIGSGSGTESCQPTAESAEIDDGMLELDFDWDDSDPMMACTADLRIFGWAFPVSGADASITQAQVDDWTQEGPDVTVDIRPAEEMG